MTEYIEVIKNGLVIFPFVAFIFTIPYLFYNYHKYGSLPFMRVLIVYSFILYLIVAYCLIIMPLPSYNEVLLMQGPTSQLIPFMFIKDLYDGILKVGLNNFYKTPAFYTIFFNICLTIPFGVYLKFYFKKSLKETILYTFLLSLFFELTQLSGLYFIYPRAYRLFDIDDLFINTLGGIIGYGFGIIVAKFMPSIDEVNIDAINKGIEISFIRRLSSFVVDWFLYLIFNMLVVIFIGNGKYIKLMTLAIYYILIPSLTKQTLANRLFKIKMVSKNNNLNFIQVLIRQVSFYLGIFILPTRIGDIIISFISNINIEIRLILALIVTFIVFMYYLILFIKLIKKEEMFYDLISKTKLISTVNKK